MSLHVLTRTLLLVCLLAYDGLADEGPAGELPARETVKVKLQAQPEMIYEEKGQTSRANIDTVTSDMPPSIAAAVKDWTGIVGFGEKSQMQVKFYHTLHNARFDAMSYASGTFKYKGHVKVGGKVLHDAESVVRYKELLAASDEKTFLVVGVMEFDNVKSGRRCYVLCQFEGQKPAASKDDPYIHPTGTATWTGPLTSIRRSPFAGDAADKRD